MHILRIILVLVLILILVRRKVQVGTTMFICAAFLALTYWMKPAALGNALVMGFIGAPPKYDTLYILAAVLMVLMLGDIMGGKGFLRKMVRAIETIFGDPRWVLGGLPAMIGLLPMPGGALFTAPMVGETADSIGISPDNKTYYNHHFRHIFEYTWPLYPGLIMLSPIVGLPVNTLAVYNLPLTLGAVIGGIIFGLAWVKAPKRVGSGGGSFWEIIDALWPILFIVILVMAFDLDLLICFALLLLLLLSTFTPWPGFILAVIVNVVLRFVVKAPEEGIFWAFYIGNGAVALALLIPAILRPVYPGVEFITFLKRALKPYMITMVFGVMLFSAMIKASGASDGFAADIRTTGLPPLVIVCCLPLVLGYLTGITVSFVAGSYPILLPFIPEGHAGLPMISLAYACGFIGVLISPVHFCLILTVEYYKSDLMRVVRLMLPACGLVFVVAMLRYIFSM